MSGRGNGSKPRAAAIAQGRRRARNARRTNNFDEASSSLRCPRGHFGCGSSYDADWRSDEHRVPCPEGPCQECTKEQEKSNSKKKMRDEVHAPPEKREEEYELTKVASAWLEEKVMPLEEAIDSLVKEGKGRENKTASHDDLAKYTVLHCLDIHDQNLLAAELLASLGNYGIKLRRPLKNYIKDYKVPTAIGALFSLNIIADRFLDENGDTDVYVRFLLNEGISRAVDSLGLGFIVAPGQFISAVEPVAEWAFSLTKRLSNKKSVQIELYKMIQKTGNLLKEKDKDAEVPTINDTAFALSYKALQMGVRNLEKWLSAGNEPVLSVPNLIKTLLECCQNLDRLWIQPLFTALVDVFGEIGPGIAKFLTEDELSIILRRLIDYSIKTIKPSFGPPGSYPPQLAYSQEVAVKAGRSIGKLVVIPQVVTNTTLSSMLFAEGFYHMSPYAGVDQQHPNICASWGWALAEYTQSLGNVVKQGIYEPPNQLYLDITYHIKAVNAGNVKSRYNGYRASGNLFSFYKPVPARNIGHEFQVLQAVSDLVDQVIQQMGQGLEYKNRWNAAFGLGCVFENPALSGWLSTRKSTHMHDRTTLSEIVITLASWVKQSQNYKERIQCLIALRKIKDRTIIRGTVGDVLSNILASYSTLPSEDNEMLPKYRAELVMSLSNVISLLSPDDILQNFMGAVAPYEDNFQRLCQAVKGDLNGPNADHLLRGRDRLEEIQGEVFSTALNQVIRLFNLILQDGRHVIPGWPANNEDREDEDVGENFNLLSIRR